MLTTKKCVTFNKVEPPVNDHPKCKDLMVAFRRYSLMRMEPQRASSKKQSRQTFFIEDKSLVAMFKLQYYVYEFPCCR